MGPAAVGASPLVGRGEHVELAGSRLWADRVVRLDKAVEARRVVRDDIAEPAAEGRLHTRVVTWRRLPDRHVRRPAHAAPGSSAGLSGPRAAASAGGTCF